MSNRRAYLNTTYNRYMVEKVEPGLHNLSDDDWKKLTNDPDTLCITIDEFNKVINSFERFIFVNEETIRSYNNSALLDYYNPLAIPNLDIARISPLEIITPRQNRDLI